jgi:uncharacterized protein YegL
MTDVSATTSNTSSSRSSSIEDKLKNTDYTLMVDKSGSMDTNDVEGYGSRWDAIAESCLAIARKLDKYDPDGITLYVFNGNHKRYDNVTPDRVTQVFQENDPLGGTALHLALKHAFDSWKERKRKGELKSGGEHIVVVTDGCPDDEDKVAKEIVSVTKSMTSADELHITILQIGKDVGARDYLKRLDDNLQSEGAKYDAVDVHTFDDLQNTTFKAVLLASVERRK